MCSYQFNSYRMLGLRFWFLDIRVSHLVRMWILDSSMGMVQFCLFVLCPICNDRWQLAMVHNLQPTQEVWNDIFKSSWVSPLFPIVNFQIDEVKLPVRMVLGRYASGSTTEWRQVPWFAGFDGSATGGCEAHAGEICKLKKINGWKYN